MQAIVSRYPWFSYAREVLLCRLVEIEPECLESRYKENLIFFPRRDAVLLKCRQIVSDHRSASEEETVEVAALLDVDGQALESGEDDFEIDFEQIQREAEDFTLQVEPAADDMVIEEEGNEVAGVAEEVEQFRPRVVVVGGDYFTKEDFAQLEESERAREIRLGAPADNEGENYTECAGEFEVDFDSMDFVTETLASIYADQGYYDKAIEVYAKLILLYPEKSTYFASLVNEIKSKY